MTDDWTQEEAGWWTHPVHGGLCREEDGRWHHHRLRFHDPHGGGPWKTLREARTALNDRPTAESQPGLTAGNPGNRDTGG